MLLLATCFLHPSESKQLGGPLGNTGALAHNADLQKNHFLSLLGLYSDSRLRSEWCEAGRGLSPKIPGPSVIRMGFPFFADLSLL